MSLQKAGAYHTPELIIKFFTLLTRRHPATVRINYYGQSNNFKPDLDRRITRPRQFLDTNKNIVQELKNYFLLTNTIAKIQFIDAAQHERLYFLRSGSNHRHKYYSQKTFSTTALLANV